MPTAEVQIDQLVTLCAPTPLADFVTALLRTGFSPQAYRDEHPDLRAYDIDAIMSLEHYLCHGINERRLAHCTVNPSALAELASLPIDNAEFRAQLLTSIGFHLFNGADHPYGAAIAEDRK